jgi:hypothetical protein
MSKEETNATTEEKTSAENGNMPVSDLHREIEKAMDQDEDKTPAPAEDSPVDGDNPDATKGGGEAVAPDTPEATEATDGDKPDGADGGDGGDGEATISDELIERAVKAGISLADTRTFTDPKVLERTIALVEGKSGSKPDTTTDDGDKGSGDGISADNLPAELSEDEFDEGLVKAFNGMRSLVIEQGKLLAKYAKEWDSSKAAQEAEAAAKAQAQAEAKKKAALEKRKSLALAKPGGESGAKQKTTMGYGDGEYADIIAGLESKGIIQ